MHKLSIAYWIKLLIIYLVFSLQSGPSNGQQDIDYYTSNYIRNNDHIYLDHIKTVLIHLEGDQLSPPIIRLHSGNRLQVSFDDLESGVKDYRYTIVHCDANWLESDLFQNEYITGFMEDNIDDYKFSFNTIQSFTHYKLFIPSRDLMFSLSGNYILKVYISDESDIALTMRFMVIDPKVTIEGRVKRASDISDRNYRQEIDFVINTSAYPIVEPYRNLNVMILQNNRWDNAITNLKPKLIIGDDLDYNYDKENIFDAGNEFRNFDIKSQQYRSPRIQSFGYENQQNHVFLWDDKNRSHKTYTFDEDINGKRLISCEDARDIAIECDYTWVHFFLPYSTPIADGNLYIMGAFTHWQFTKEGLMNYNAEKSGYEASLYLKEGYYNYLIIYLENGSEHGTMSKIEGNHFDTENDYLILVYYRKSGLMYDELIGVEVINSLH